MSSRVIEEIIEKLALLPQKEREEIIIALEKLGSKEEMTTGGSNDPTTATAGAWKDLIDCDKLLEEIYFSRLVPSARESGK